jgi:hypothetical protein
MNSEKTTLIVEPGVCRFTAKIECWMDEEMQLRCSIQSGCKHVQQFAAELGQCDIMTPTKLPFSENKVYVVGGTTLVHATCPIPMAVLKGFEVAAGLGLKRDIIVKFQNDSP